MIDDIKQDASTRMIKSVEALKENLTKIRTGRAHPAMLDHCLLYTSPSPRDATLSRMPSSA